MAVTLKGEYYASNQDTKLEERKLYSCLYFETYFFLQKKLWLLWRYLKQKDLKKLRPNFQDIFFQKTSP